MAIGIGRRRFISAFSGAAVVWPIAARAQQPAIPIIGILAAPAAAPSQDFIAAFREGIRQNGFVENQNVTIEYRWADGDYNRLPAMAKDLIGKGVAVIVALAPAAAQSAKAETTSVPIVFVLGNDPVGLGLVTSLNRPGGNVTGVSFLINALAGKRLQLIHEMVPTSTAIGLLVNPRAPGAVLDRQDAEKSAGTLGQSILVVSASSEDEIEECFATLAKARVGALVISPDALFTTRREQLIALAAHYALPTIYHLREAVADGGLISYGTNIADAHRLAGIYAGRILRGEKPANLPIQQSTKFDLVINRTTAKALGLMVPPTLLALADEVIE